MSSKRFSASWPALRWAFRLSVHERRGSRLKSNLLKSTHEDRTSTPRGISPRRSYRRCRRKEVPSGLCALLPARIHTGWIYGLCRLPAQTQKHVECHYCVAVETPAISTTDAIVSQAQVLTVIAVSRTPLWLPSGWEFRGRHLSRGRGNPDRLPWLRRCRPSTRKRGLGPDERTPFRIIPE
jgi:hypothetical protein